MAKYSQEFKLEVIEYVLEKHYSSEEAAKKFNISSCTSVKKWVNRYREHGAEGILRNIKKYDGQFKIEVIEYMNNNRLSLQETANTFRIAGAEVIAKWERIYYEEGQEALFRDNRGRKKMSIDNKPRKRKINKKVEEDLIAENQRLRMENAYLKKLNALVQERIQRENGKK